MRRYGRSTIAFVILLGLIIFTSSVWMLQTTEKSLENSVRETHSHFTQELKEEGVDVSDDNDALTDSHVQQTMERVTGSFTSAVLIQMALIIGALAILFSINSLTQKREQQIEVEKALAEEASRAKTSFLSNMSHEIRTPMNAIIGLDNIALRNPDLHPKTREQPALFS